MRRRFVVQHAGEVITDGYVDDDGRIWWRRSKDNHPLPRDVSAQVEFDLTAGRTSGVIGEYQWLEIDDTVTVRQIRQLS